MGIWHIFCHISFQCKVWGGLARVDRKGKLSEKYRSLRDQQLFEGTTNYTCLLFLDKGGNNDFRFIKVNDVPAWQDRGEAVEGMVSAKEVTSAEWNFVVGRASKVFDKLRNMPLKLADVSNRIYQGLSQVQTRFFSSKNMRLWKKGRN